MIMDSGGSQSRDPSTNPPELAHRAASGAMWIALEMGSTQLASLVVFAIMARFVTPSDFGLISISYLAITTFKSLVIDNVVVAISRKKQPSDLEYTTSFWLTLGFAAIASLGIVLSAGVAERLMNAPHLKEVMRAMSVILLFMGLARTHEMRMIRSFHFRKLALRNIAGAVSGGGIGIALAMHDYGLAALVIQQIATSAISLALLWVSSSWTPSFRISAETIREILIFMRSIAPSNLAGILSQNCDTFLVAYFFGPASVGLYAIAKRLRLALQLVAATPISGVVFSTLAEVLDDRERLKRVSERMIALISFVCAPIFVGSSSIAREVVSIGFGEQWSTAGPIFAVLTLGGFFSTLQNFSDTMFVLKNRQIWSFYLLLIQTILAILIFFPIRELGPDYLAVPFILPYAMTSPVSAFLVSRLAGLSLLEWALAVMPSLASSVLMFGAVRSIGANVIFSSDLLQAAICSASGMVVYLVAMLVISRTTVISALQIILNLVRTGFHQATL
jgi:O-antigen/teichoic acid export membrane protein